MPLRLLTVFVLWWIAVVPLTVGAAFFGAWLQRLELRTIDTDALYGDPWLSVDEAIVVWDVRGRLYDILERDRVPLGGAIVPGAEDYVIRAVLEASDSPRGQ